MAMKAWAKQTGFTIVELLIVIIVIGILAAITIVAYNGIQTRAGIATAQSDLGSMGKRIQLYIADNSDAYPTSDAAITQIMKDAGVWNETRTAKKQYVFCASAAKYAVVTFVSPNIPYGVATAGERVYFWSTEKANSSYINNASDNNWTPNCTQAVGTVTWRQSSTAL